MTVVSVLWSRVELQVLRYTPWWSLQSREDVKVDEYCLDYTEMLLPMVLLRSFKNKHYMVTIASITTLLLKAQIVLSSSIFELVNVRAEIPVEARSLDSFGLRSDGAYELAFSDSELMANADGVRHFGMALPFGVSESCAYQTFAPPEREGSPSGRPSIDMPLVVVVDGLFMESECLKLESYTSDIDGGRSEESEIGFELKFEGCDTVISRSYSGTVRSLWDMRPLPEDDRPCASLPQENPQWLYLAAHFATPDNEEPSIDGFGAALCSSHSWLSRVEVFDDGLTPQLTAAAGQTSNTTFYRDPLYILTETVAWNSGRTTPRGAKIAGLYLGYMNKDLDMEDSLVYDSSLLSEAVTAMTNHFGPFLAHTTLRKPREDSLQASFVEHQDRLQVNLGVCTAVIVLCTACLIFASFTLRAARKLSGTCHRDPMTLLGLITITLSNGRVRDRLDDSMSTVNSSREESWSHGTYTPLVLRPLVRTLFYLFALSLLISLGLTLRSSRLYDGLLTVSDSSYVSMLWQTVPALAMLIASLYSSSVDTSLRSLATVSTVSVRPCQSRDLDESLLDMMGLRALVASCKRRLLPVASMQVVAMVCTFLPILSSVLFSLERVPGVQQITLNQESWFGDMNRTGDDYLRASRVRDTLGKLNMIKNRSNFTYPLNTYADLLFPTFTLEESLWGPGISASVVIPAAKLTSSCEKLSGDEYDISPLPKSPLWLETHIKISQNYTCRGSNEVHNLSTIFYKGRGTDDDAHFGATFESPRRSGFIQSESACNDSSSRPSEPLAEPPWQLVAHIWGKLSPAGNDNFQHIASPKFESLVVWECNYTWAEVTTDMTVLYSNGEMRIDHNNPPKPRDSDDPRPWDPPFRIPKFDADDDGHGGSVFSVPFDGEDLFVRNLDNRFRSIIEPLGPLAIEDLADPNREDQILQALHSDMGFAAAQLANLESRLSLDEQSDSTPSHHGFLRPINATVVDSERHRLVQNQGISIAMMAILSLVCLIHSWALISGFYRRIRRISSQRPWLLDIGVKGLAPPQFGTIAATHRLLRGSNIASVLPADAHMMQARELQSRLGGRQFRLGWFYDIIKRSDVYTLGVLDDGELEFKGAKQRFGKSG